MRKTKQDRGSPVKTLGAPLDKRQELLASFCGLWEIESRTAAAVAVLGQGGGMQEVTNIRVVALQCKDCIFILKTGQKTCHTCYMCSRRAEGAGKGKSVSVPDGPAPEFGCGVCSSCLEGGWV